MHHTIITVCNYLRSSLLEYEYIVIMNSPGIEARAATIVDM